MTPAEKERHLAYYDRTARTAYSHCCSILIGCPHRPTAETNSATGVFLLLDDHHYLITASHVIGGFANKLLHDPPAHFQIGSLVFNPLNRIVFQDQENDLVVLAVDADQVPYVGQTPYQPVGAWPPTPPPEGAYVQLTGFAAANRINGPRGNIESFSLHMTGVAMVTHNGNFFVRIEREGVPTDNVHLAVSPGESLGGMSGGAVMLFFQEPLPLIGIISEMSDLMDAVRVSAASHLRIPDRSSVFLT
jgi:hypothetical protein